MNRPLRRMRRVRCFDSTDPFASSCGNNGIRGTVGNSASRNHGGCFSVFPSPDCAACQDVGESLHRAESALSAVATSLGVGEDAVQRWKVASGGTGGTGDEDPLAVRFETRNNED